MQLLLHHRFIESPFPSPSFSEPSLSLQFPSFSLKSYLIFTLHLSEMSSPLLFTLLLIKAKRDHLLWRRSVCPSVLVSSLGKKSPSSILTSLSITTRSSTPVLIRLKATGLPYMTFRERHFKKLSAALRKQGYRYIVGMMSVFYSRVVNPMDVRADYILWKIRAEGSE